MKRASFSAWFYLGTVFLAGGVVGVFADHLYTTKTVMATPAKDYKTRYVEEVRTRLKLTPDQLRQLGVILDDTQLRMRELHERDRPVMAAIHNDQVAKIHAILTDSQWAEYQKMLADRDRKRQEQEKKAALAGK